MKRSLNYLMIFAIPFLLGSCAATYKPIKPTNLNYGAHNLEDGISLSYKYDVLNERGNKKYSKKENSKGIKVIAIKITNNTDTVINVNRDILFYSGQNQVFPMEPVSIHSNIKQIVPGYLPYLLFSFLNLYVTTGSGTETYRIGLILGPGLTIGNMLTAASANEKLMKELNEYNILYRDIQKGETIFGIIGLKNVEYNPISLRLK